MASNETLRVVPPSTISQIGDILTRFMKECDIIYPHDIHLDASYRAECYADATRRGFDLAILGRFLDVTIAFGDTAYRHLKNRSTRVFIAILAAIMLYIEDSYQTCGEGLKDFVDCFLRQEQQRFEVLDQFASAIRELPHHWGMISSNLITTSGIDFLTSMIIEDTIDGMTVGSLTAPDFPQFIRRMTGISRAYSIMVFPPELDLKMWIQVVPDLMHYIDHTNDLFSFFKEELQGENINYVSMCANSDNIPKIEALRKLAAETIQSYKRGLQFLQSTPGAWEAYRAFCVGYVGFHTSSARYKLDQLHL